MRIFTLLTGGLLQKLTSLALICPSSIMCQGAQALSALQPSYTLKEKKHCGQEGPLQTPTFTDQPAKEALAEINLL